MSKLTEEARLAPALHIVGPATVGGTGGSADRLARAAARATALNRDEISDEGESQVRLTIVMPAYNEVASIRAALHELLSVAYPCPVEFIVVDDGSTDGTADVAESVNDDRLRVIRHPHNLGKGAALRTGIQHATGTYFLPFDADLEYRAADIVNVLAPVISGAATIVYGSRLFGWNTVYQSYRYKLGNLFTTLAANILFDSALSDLHTCIKLMPLPMLRSMALRESRFGLDTEVTAKMLRSGHRPFEVPIHYYSRTHAQGKKISWRDGVRCLLVLVRVRVSSAPVLPEELRPAVTGVLPMRFLAASRAVAAEMAGEMADGGPMAGHAGHGGHAGLGSRDFNGDPRVLVDAHFAAAARLDESALRVLNLRAVDQPGRTLEGLFEAAD